MPTIYSHVVARDKGIAPNVCGGVLTVALCKPKIRSGAKVGDWVVGLWPAPNRKRVTYAMHVGRKLPFAQYWSAPEFQTKKWPGCKTPDNIYQPVGAAFKQESDTDHVACFPDDMRSHLSGEFVLVADRFWYFGGTPCDLPTRFWSLDLPGSRRGHRKQDWSTAKLADIQGWLESHGEGVLGKPRDPM